MKPENPETIIVKNKYYPQGLTEGMIFDYYIKFKKKILNELGSKFVLLFIAPNVNDLVIKRNLEGKKIVLTEKNYEQIITGRTLSISVEMPDTTDYVCIDIDPGPNAKEWRLQDAVSKLLNSPLVKLSNNHRVTSTSRGYHVYFYLKSPMSINVANQTCKKLISSEFRSEFIVDGIKPKGDEVKFDMAITRNKGSHTVPYSICRNGLMCLDVTKTYQNFRREKAIIKL